MVRIYATLVVLLLLTGLSNAQTVDSTCNLLIMIIDDPPYFKGDLKEFIQGEISYPDNAQKDSIEGKVFVSFWIDTLGNTYSHQIIKGIQEELNNEALRVAKLIKFERPAMQRGKPIKMKFTVPIEFKLVNTEKKIRCKKR
ncbi:MAG: energy transducer TonB [Draconibacterium sp.]|nr:energy transducer TonB [Draconibacterium sp.]